MTGSKQWKPGVEAMSRRKFEEWIAKDSTLSASRDQHGYTDITVAIMWHTWKSATASMTPNWPNHDAAFADPVFHQIRGIMGTQNWGQEDALRQAVLYVLRAYSETGLEASTQPPKGGDKE